MTDKSDKQKSKFKSTNIDANIFNRDLLRIRRDNTSKQFHNHDFLLKEVTHRLLDNLEDIERDFHKVLNIGGHPNLTSDYFSDAFLLTQDLSLKKIATLKTNSIQADEEFLPIKNKSLDLVFCALNLHWINDLPGALVQILQSLKPDGLFIGAALGGETLYELRTSMMKADIERLGGIRPHASPLMDIRDAGNLLQRAGFTLPVLNTERITVTYSDALTLMKELKGMGENNALLRGYKGLTTPAHMMKFAEIYAEDFANQQGRIPVTFDIIYFQGWSPHESQQKPLKPGSAKMSLKDALGKSPPNSNEKSL